MGGATVAEENQIKPDSKRSPEEACGQRAADDNKHSLSSLQSTFHLSALLVVLSPPLLLFSASPEEEGGDSSAQVRFAFLDNDL